MLRIGVVGAGGISLDHLNAINKNDSCCLAGISDIIEERAKKLAVDFNTSYYKDYKEMCEKERLDAAIITLPHFLHCESSVYFLEKGVHVLVEKPMANTAKECEKMIRASESSGAKLTVGHVQRFFESNIKLHEIIKNRKYGDLCMITEIRTTNYFNENRPKWFLDKKQAGGGIVMNYMAHSLDKIFYFLGNTITHIASDCGNYTDYYSIEGNAQVLLKLANRVSAAITFCGYKVPDVHEAIYYFTNGMVKITDESSIWITENNCLKKVSLHKTRNAFESQLSEFIRYINGKPCNIADAQYGKEVIQVIEEIYRH